MLKQKKPMRVHFCIPVIGVEEYNKPASKSMPPSHQKVMTKIYDDLLSDPVKFTQLLNDTIKANASPKNGEAEPNAALAPELEEMPVHVPICIPLIDGREAEKAKKSASTSSSRQPTMDAVFGDLASEPLASHEFEAEDSVKAFSDPESDPEQPEKTDAAMDDTVPEDTPPNEGDPSAARASETTQSKKNLLKRQHEVLRNVLPMEDVDQRKKQIQTELDKMEGDVAMIADKPASPPSSCNQQSMEIAFDHPGKNPSVTDDDASPNATPPNEAEPSTAPAAEATTSLTTTPPNEAETKPVRVSFCIYLMEEVEGKEAGKAGGYATSRQQSMEMVFGDLDLETQTFTQPEGNNSVNANIPINITPPDVAEPSAAPASKKKPTRVYFCIRSWENVGEDEAKNSRKPASKSKPPKSSLQETLSVFFVNLSSDPLMLNDLYKNKALKSKLRLKTAEEAEPKRA